MFSKLTKRTLVVLIAVIALVATTAGAAMAAGGPSDYLDSPPAGIPNTQTGSYWEYELLFPWEHTIVIAHVTAGSEPVPTDQLPSKNPGIVDPYTAVASLEEYASGQIVSLVDAIITVSPEFFSLESPLEGGGLGSSRSTSQDEYGDIALALSKAHDECDREWTECDVVLVTYEAPESPAHRRHAMAEAMKLVTSGHRLHTVVVDLGSECVGETTPNGGCYANNLISKVDPAHVEFSQLLGAVGHNAIVDPLGFADAFYGIIGEQYWREDFFDSTEAEEDTYEEYIEEYIRETLEESFEWIEEIGAHLEGLEGFEELTDYFDCIGELIIHFKEFENLDVLDEEYSLGYFQQCLGLESPEEAEEYAIESELAILEYLKECSEEDSCPEIPYGF